VSAYADWALSINLDTILQNTVKKLSTRAINDKYSQVRWSALQGIYKIDKEYEDAYSKAKDSQIKNFLNNQKQLVRTQLEAIIAKNPDEFDENSLKKHLIFLD
jgi:hypothetical protein